MTDQDIQRAEADLAKLRAETAKLAAEREKLLLDARKLLRDIAWQPVLILTGLMGASAAIGGAVVALLRH